VGEGRTEMRGEGKGVGENDGGEWIRTEINDEGKCKEEEKD